MVRNLLVASQTDTWANYECTSACGYVALVWVWFVQEDWAWQCLRLGWTWSSRCQLHLHKISHLFYVISYVYMNNLLFYSYHGTWVDIYLWKCFLLWNRWMQINGFPHGILIILSIYKIWLEYILICCSPWFFCAQMDVFDFVFWLWNNG